MGCEVGVSEQQRALGQQQAHPVLDGVDAADEVVPVHEVEQGDEAWVEVYAGIDINPAALTLPAVPLDS